MQMPSMSQWRFPYLFLCLLLFLGACGSHQTPTSSIHAYVSEKERELAFSLVDNIDYIPFAFTRDGCYGRALYMAMELASAEVPSSSLYIYGTLRPTPNLSWRFHVAPLLIDRVQQTTYVLDPSLATAPVAVDKWLELVNPGAGYQTHIQDGSTYYTSIDLKKPQNIIDNFSELSSFRISDVLAACQTMHSYLRYDTQGRLVERREKLLAKTGELLEQLQRLGKIQYDRPIDVIRSCGRGAFF